MAALAAASVATAAVPLDAEKQAASADGGSVPTAAVAVAATVQTGALLYRGHNLTLLRSPRKCDRQFICHIRALSFVAELMLH